MGTRVVGKVDWDDGDVNEGNFVKLEEGENTVRIATSPYQFYIHWTTDATGKTVKVNCAIDDCPVCKRGEDSKARWYVGVLNRKISKPGILEIGPQVYKSILSLRKKKAWGDPRAYDIDIERRPKGTNPLYVTSPLPKEPLNDDEKEMLRKFIKDTRFDEMIQPPTAADVLEKLGLSDDDVSDVESLGDDFDNFEEDEDLDFE